MLAIVDNTLSGMNSAEDRKYALVEYDGNVSASGNILSFRVVKGQYYGKRIDKDRILSLDATEELYDTITAEVASTKDMINNLRFSLQQTIKRLAGK